MKTKLLSLFVALFATTALLASNVITYTATSKLTETTSTYSHGLHTNAFNVAITSHTFSNGTGTITFAGDVTTIGEGAFYECSSLTSITIPNSVTTIGYRAFEGCTSLTSITIPNSVTTIGERAFYSCKSLTSVTIPNSVTTIGEYAFYYCKSLTSITIPNSVTTIGYDAFGYCSGLTSINVDAGNANYCSIDGVLFNYVKNTLIQYPIGNTRTAYTIPNSVTTIGEHAFDGCSGLTSVTIPNSVTTIGAWAFQSCSGLTSVTIPSSVTTIGEWAFYLCRGLTSITIPSSVTTIGEHAFDGCSGLTSINVDAGNANYCSIDGVLFNYVKDTLIQYPIGNARTAYTIPSSVTTIGKSAFSSCSGLTSVTIPNSVTTIGDGAFGGCSGLTSITIPNSVTTIGREAFCYCHGLTSITIPNSVTTIGGRAFSGCSGLTSIVVDTENTKYDSRNNCNAIIETTSNTLITGCKNTTIPNSVTTIGEHAFDGCSGLTSVTIPNSVTKIEGYAFLGCIDLTSITCEATTPPTCGSGCFTNVDHSIPLYVPAASIEAYKTANEWKDFTNIQAIPATTSITLYDRPTGGQTWQEAADHLQAQLTDLKNKCDADPTLTCDVRIVRTIAHNGVLTPICLPFSLSADEISNASSPLHQAYIYSFDCRVQKNSNEVEVRMRRQNHIIAGVPYVIKFTHGDDQDYFDFKDVRITVDEPLTDESTAMNFVGNFLPIPLESSENILYVTTDGSLCWWDSSIDDGVTYLRGFRAHFVINTPALKSIRRGMKVVMVEQEDTDTPTDLDWVKNAENTENNVNAHPQKVIINGQLYIIRDGKTYNALGAMVD